jgi:hypothetical protein
VHRLICSWHMVAFKMGRRQGGPSRTGAEGEYLNRYVTDPAAAGQPPAHFQRNPPGRGQLPATYETMH